MNPAKNFEARCRKPQRIPVPSYLKRNAFCQEYVR